MKTASTVALVFLAAIVAWVIGGMVIGFVATVLHYAVILAIFGGICYVGYSLANPRKTLGWRGKILP